MLRFHLDIIEECESTNELLMQARGGPDFHGRAILALTQKNGQGRRGRQWWSGSGNLALSFGLQLNQAERAPIVPIYLAVATAEFLHSLSPNLSLRLKWPNDIYLDGKKFAGILSQAKQQGPTLDLVVGIGANLAQAPADVQPTIALASLGIQITPKDFAIGILAGFEKRWNQNLDFSSLAEEWEKYAQVRGASLAIVGEQIRVEGIGLMPSGELEVWCDGKKRALSSEEISIRF